MNNLGKANVKAEILPILPGITKEATEYNFDITSSQWDAIVNSPYFPPQLAEYFFDSTDGFTTIFPTRRKLYIDNFIEGTTGEGIIDYSPLSTPYVSWKVINSFQNRGVITKISQAYPSYVVLQPGQQYPTDYIGPEWRVIKEVDPEHPDDISVLKTWAESTRNSGSVDSFLLDKINEVGYRNLSVTKDAHYVHWIHQQKARDGLFWGVESSAFLPVIQADGVRQTSMPFCVNIKMMQKPPATTPATTSSTATPAPSTGSGQVAEGSSTAQFPQLPQLHDTAFIISLGIDDEQNAFDIVLNQNAKPFIADYTAGRNNSIDNAGNIGASVVVKEGDPSIASILSSQEEISISVMTIAGRLVVWVNEVCICYTRVSKEAGDSAGTIKECMIGSGRIAIYGANVQAKINVCPLTFSPFAAFVVPIISIIRNSSSDPITISYKGVNNRGEVGGSVSKIPQQPDRPGDLWGVDCFKFVDNVKRGFGGAQLDGSEDIGSGWSGSSYYPKGYAFHNMGTVYFFNAGAANVNAYENSDFHIILMQSGGAKLWTQYYSAGDGYVIWHWGCPFFFRIKGAHRKTVALQDVTPQVIPEVISATETLSAPDYFHSLSSASVVIYNKDKTYDYLRDSQYGIRLSWGWGDNLIQTFTGVIVNVSSSEVAGKEMLTLQCEDYMTILKNTPIVNSPFYDGMVMFYAIKDLAKRGGVINCINDQPLNADNYFLPSGYTFTKPVMRFPSTNMIFNCMMDIVKRFEAFIRFDSSGSLHVYKLPGGLFGTIPPGTTLKEFKRDPTQADVSGIILNEKNVEYNFASTVNEISILSIDRDSRNAILYAKSASSTGQDHLMYKKTYLCNQAALGEIAVVRAWAAELGNRMFFPIRKTSFSTVGGDVTGNNILDFVKIDGLEYRILSISRKYDAGSNDLSIEYNCEWLNG